MNYIQCGITVSLLAGLAACSGMTGNGAASGHATPAQATAEPPVSPGMVRQVQSKLRDDGYYSQGTVDGVWGLGTQSAVRLFQHDHNLNAGGQLDVPTLQALNLASNSAATGVAAPNQPMTPTSAPATVNPTTGTDVAPNAPAH